MNRFVAITTALAAVVAGHAADPVDFKKQVRPILEVYCLKCHGSEKPKGDLSMVSRADAIKGGESGPALVPGDPAKSKLYTSTALPDGHDDLMPPKGDRLNTAQQETLKNWIEQGATWPDEFKLSQKQKVDFVKEVKPIFEVHCVACHKLDHNQGNLRMDDKAEFFKSPAIVRGDSGASKVYTTTILPADHDDLMPPTKKGGPLPKAKTDLIRDWIDQGAEWPDGVALTQKEAGSTLTRDNNAMLDAIYARVTANSKEASAADMKEYADPISGTEVKFDMIPIPAGEFTMGSPDGEAKRKADEGPQRKVKIEPFWIGKTEVTWNEYELFQFPSLEKGTNVPTERMERELWLAFPDLLPANAKPGINPYVGKESDAVSRPTTPYVEMSFGMGKDGFPAISMTHYAAVKYCKWLTAKTGHFYRLATEAEWEYACRAGTTTKYSFGDDESKLGEYAWSYANSDGKYQQVGKKKPNPWGLYDMHGNVAEWVLDAYVADYSKVGDLPYVPGVEEYPHVARGGSWDDDAELLRSAARRASDQSWKMRDPQLPKSKWYLTDAQFLGFRVVRPLKVPPREEIERYWTSFPPKQ
jgi:formylglycine-generating enzyme required for sulfatase activity/mono/diheme cytochrome c family protein